MHSKIIITIECLRLNANLYLISPFIIRIFFGLLRRARPVYLTKTNTVLYDYDNKESTKQYTRRWFHPLFIVRTDRLCVWGYANLSWSSFQWIFINTWGTAQPAGDNQLHRISPECCPSVIFQKLWYENPCRGRTKHKQPGHVRFWQSDNNDSTGKIIETTHYVREEYLSFVVSG